nr:uncharacterized protein LOC124805836 isoform X2 [Hydra vulgaris]
MNSTCCCCWEKYGERSKSLKKINKNLEEQIQMFIFPGYSMNNDCYPSVVCPGCRRNLYRLKKGDSPRGEWGAKVEWKTLLRNSPRTSLTLPDEITNFPTTKSSISNLKNSFLSAQEVAVNLNKQINTTWKVHILLCHVQPYVEHHNKGLGNFAEQCGESIHAKFKPTWTRFKRQIEHSEHGDRLLSAVVDFGAKRIRFCL